MISNDLGCVAVALAHSDGFDNKSTTRTRGDAVKLEENGSRESCRSGTDHQNVRVVAALKLVAVGHFVGAFPETEYISHDDDVCCMLSVLRSAKASFKAFGR